MSIAPTIEDCVDALADEIALVSSRVDAANHRLLNLIRELRELRELRDSAPMAQFGPNPRSGRRRRSPLGPGTGAPRQRKEPE